MDDETKKNIFNALGNARARPRGELKSFEILCTAVRYRPRRAQMRSGRINFAKRTDYFGPGRDRFFPFLFRRCLGTAPKNPRARSFNVRRCLANLPSYYNDDDANELPVVLPVGRIVRGWNIIRAYGRPPLFLSRYLSLSLFRSCTPTPSRSASPASPETLYLLAFSSLAPFSFFFASSFFHQCLRSFWPVHGEHRSRSLTS